MDLNNFELVHYKEITEKEIIETHECEIIYKNNKIMIFFAREVVRIL